MRIIPGEAGGRDLSDGLVLVTMEAGTWEALGDGVPPGLTSPTHPQWSLCLGTWWRRTARCGARPRTASRAKSARARRPPCAATATCATRLCRAGRAPRPPAPVPTLAWRWPAASSPSSGPLACDPQNQGPTPSSPWPGWRLRHPGLGALQTVWGQAGGPGAERAEGLERPWHKRRRLPPRAAGWGRGQEAFRSLLISSSSVWFLFVFLFKAQHWNK